MRSGHHGDSTVNGFKGGREDSFTIFAFECRKFAGAAKGRDGIDAFGDQPVDVWLEAFEPELTIGVEGGDGGGADTAKRGL